MDLSLEVHPRSFVGERGRIWSYDTGYVAGCPSKRFGESHNEPGEPYGGTNFIGRSHDNSISFSGLGRITITETFLSCLPSSQGLESA